MVIEERRTVPTPWEEVNDILGGGVSGGELCVVCAGTGVGKSHALVDLGYYAASQGYNVAHYTFELGDVQIGRRYDSRATGIIPESLMENREEVKERIETIPGKIIIKSYPTKSITTLAIKNHLQKLALRDFRPDVG